MLDHDAENPLVASLKMPCCHCVLMKLVAFETDVKRSYDTLALFCIADISSPLLYFMYNQKRSNVQYPITSAVPK